MKVLVAGLGKTGTKTMATALRLLGYEVYDWMENFYYLGDDWQKQVKEGFKIEDMRRMYENVDAVMDGPCDVYWEEIFDAFPDVKVILTTRDENSWVESWKRQVEEMNNDIMFRLARTVTYTGVKAQFHFAFTGNHMARHETWPYSSWKALPDETLKRVKRRHERDLKLVVPREQLLVYEVKEGWKPLCDFLSVPVPDYPFPHKNKAACVLDELRKENLVMQRIETELMIFIGCFFFLCAICMYIFGGFFR